MDRYGFDDLRQFAAALGTACGLAPSVRLGDGLAPALV